MYEQQLGKPDLPDPGRVRLIPAAHESYVQPEVLE